MDLIWAFHTLYQSWTVVTKNASNLISRPLTCNVTARNSNPWSKDSNTLGSEKILTLIGHAEDGTEGQTDVKVEKVTASDFDELCIHKLDVILFII